MFQQFLKYVITTTLVTATVLFGMAVYNGATGSDITLSKVPGVGFVINSIDAAGKTVGEKIKRTEDR